jgi:hypothetical protein
MLRVVEGRSRRDFLRIGGAMLGAGAINQLCAAHAWAKTNAPAYVTDRSVILVFLHGGPTQYETFDPKPDASSSIRSTTGATTTNVPGMLFGGTFTKLAQVADRVSIVRSYVTGNGGTHNIHPVVTKDSQNANVGAWYSRIVGTSREATGMPTNLTLFPRAVDAECGPESTNFGKFDATGNLGAAYAPFSPGGGGMLQKDMTLNLSRERLDDRRELLGELDRVRYMYDQGTLNKFQAQAFESILGGVSNAFDWKREGEATIKRYDTAPLVTPSEISKKWNNYKHYVDNAKSLGKLLLLARRLCEAGAGFITVTTNFVWDYHADSNNCGCAEGMEYTGKPLDHALTTLIQDCAERGLSDKIMIVVTGEMGRTPAINKKGGRDHWGNITPLLISGGGIKTGQIIGQSTRNGGEPATEPVTTENLYATLFHALFNVSELRLQRHVPTELLQKLTAWSPISGLS